MHIELLIFGFCIFAISNALPVRNSLRQFGCDEYGRCSMVVSLLRDPRMMPTWRGKDAWNKALVQMNGYQDLFGSEDEEPVVENSETSMPQGGARSRRAIVEKYASPNEETKENMYWLIKLPGK